MRTAVKQTILGRGPRFGEEPGNCFQAALASMLGLRLEEVPHFMAEYLVEGQAGIDKVWAKIQAWLTAHYGLCALLLPPAGDWVPGEEYGCYLAFGTSVRGAEHVVVMKAGRLVHDPHPSDAGLVRVDSVGFLVRVVD